MCLACSHHSREAMSCSCMLLQCLNCARALGKEFFARLTRLMSSGPINPLILGHEGNAIERWRELMGPTKRCCSIVHPSCSVQSNVMFTRQYSYWKIVYSDSSLALTQHWRIDLLCTYAGTNSHYCYSNMRTWGVSCIYMCFKYYLWHGTDLLKKIENNNFGVYAMLWWWLFLFSILVCSSMYCVCTGPASLPRGASEPLTPVRRHRMQSMEQTLRNESRGR